MSKQRRDLDEKYYSDSFQKEEKQKRSPKFDMTPMTDLAFLLLVFFMIAATFAKPQLMNLIMPQEKPQEEQAQQLEASKALHLLIRQNDNLSWYIGSDISNRQQLTIKELGSFLRGKKQEMSELMVLLKPSDEASYESVVKTIDELNLAAIERYALMEPNADELQNIMN